MSFVSELAPVPESAFPCPPLRRRIGAGEGARGTGEEGTREARRPRALRPGETARGRRRPCPSTRAPLLHGEVRAANAPGIPTRPLCPLRAGASGRRPSRAAPTQTGALGLGGRRELRIRRPGPAPGPQLRVRAPAGTPPRALPACARPPRGPSRRPCAPTPLGTASRRPTGRAPGANAAGRAEQERVPCPRRPRCLGTEAAAGARSAAALQGSGCHDCGQYRDARARSGPIGTLGRQRSPLPGRSPVRPEDSRYGRRALDRVLSQRGGPDSGSGFPQEGARARSTRPVQRSKGRGAQRGAAGRAHNLANGYGE